MAAVAGNLPPFPQRLHETAVFKPPKALTSFERRYWEVCFSLRLSNVRPVGIQSWKLPRFIAHQNYRTISSAPEQCYIFDEIYRVKFGSLMLDIVLS